jgi:hypothetical protein
MIEAIEAIKFNQNLKNEAKKSRAKAKFIIVNGTKDISNESLFNLIRVN